jgi:hypothetical protein
VFSADATTMIWYENEEEKEKEKVAGDLFEIRNT